MDRAVVIRRVGFRFTLAAGITSLLYFPRIRPRIMQFSMWNV